ncbi:hypothetical protein MMC30_001912 [Trapelia coarctata]|nr:hypothetical protein [Trapelia coarctata]
MPNPESKRCNAQKQLPNIIRHYPESDALECNDYCDLHHIKPAHPKTRVEYAASQAAKPFTAKALPSLLPTNEDTRGRPRAPIIHQSFSENANSLCFTNNAYERGEPHYPLNWRTKPNRGLEDNLLKAKEIDKEYAEKAQQRQKALAALRERLEEVTKFNSANVGKLEVRKDPMDAITLGEALKKSEIDDGPEKMVVSEEDEEWLKVEVEEWVMVPMLGYGREDTL